jgi:hypothetical protein
MDAIREQMNRPLISGIIGLVVGLLFGLVVLGWYVFPVKWINANPVDLRYEAKVEYLRMAISAYGQDHLADKAKQRYEALGPDAEKALSDIANNPEGQNPQVVQAFIAAAQMAITSGGGVTTEGAPVEVGTPSAGNLFPQGTEVGAQTTPEPGTNKPASGSFVKSLLPILIGLVLLVLVAALVFYLLRNRLGSLGAALGGVMSSRAGASTGQPAGSAETMAEVPAAKQAEWKEYRAADTQPPMAQFMASYKLGDDLFDDSFSIDSPSGEFLGECGVGFSETIGVGDPKKVAAFEVWLFDKDDIQTVTKVMMSSHAFADDAARQRLAAKGEPVNVTPGKEIGLETQSLRLVARVVDMGYGNGAMPAESYFDRFVLELTVWQKA